MKREDVLSQIEAVCDLKVRPVTHGPNTKVRVGSEMIVLKPGGGGRTLEMSDKGVKSLAAYTGIPDTFGRNLTPATFGTVATELLEQKSQYTVILDRENKIEGFLKPGSYRNFDPERVLNTIERSLRDSEIQRVFPLKDYTVNLDIVGVEETPVVAGDLGRRGANVVFSPIGVTTPAVSSYLLRLACTNGMTTSDTLREFKFTGGGGGGDNGGNFWPWLNQSVRAAHSSIGPIIQRFRELLKENIPQGQRGAIIAALFQNARITGAVADAVRAQALEQPPQNSYDLMNLISWASSHVEMEPREVLRLRKAADVFAHEKTHDRLCPICHRQN